MTDWWLIALLSVAGVLGFVGLITLVGAGLRLLLRALWRDE